MSPIPFVLLALCGLAFGAVRPLPRLDGRIGGGVPTTIDKHPYHVSVRSEGYHFCSASIIGPYYALSSAKCYPYGHLGEIIVNTGTSFKSKDGVSKHKVIRLNVHQKHDLLDYDFAILKVDTPFPIKPVELCSVEPSADETATVTGWKSFNFTSDQLQVANVPIISRATCQEKNPGSNITNRTICATVKPDAIDSCKDDAGGPLIVNGKQCGVVSWNLACGKAEYTGFYSNVANQLAWIKTLMSV